jgi:hypothetical protein
VSRATDIKHVLDLPITGDEDHRTAHVEMDEHYIVVCQEMAELTKVDFFSTETLTIVDSMRIAATEGRLLKYHRGLLITKKGHHIR